MPESSRPKTPFWKLLVPALAIACAAAAGIYSLTHAYVLNQAEKNIQNLLLSHRGIHLYVQKMMHPALYGFQDKGKIDKKFYAPELFSSSFIVRNQHVYYNEARREKGLPEVYYKMAAENPRNPVNQADAYETKLIRRFNEEPDLDHVREVIELDGRTYLSYTMPFLRNAERCLKCHGLREDAPLQLQERYPGEGGFNETVGRVRAVESIRAPLDDEFEALWVISGTLISGLAAITGLFFFNQRLHSLVRDRTAELEEEVRVRKKAEAEVAAANEALEERVRQRTAQLQAANQELDAFAYTVSHDLRAPLRGIDGFSLALLEDYHDRLDDTGRDYLHRVRAGCLRMGNLIDDLLRMSRLARSTMTIEAVNLSEMAELVMAELRATQPDRRTKVDIQPGLVCHGDRALLRTVLDNLLGNAWKFTARIEAAHIAFGAITDQGGTVYFVRDNGAGFNMEHAAKLFVAFQRLHAASEFEGTGIGLASVQRIIHRHGGTIRAEGEVGKGATFFFTLETGARA